jgi:hypothetical protein
VAATASKLHRMMDSKLSERIPLVEQSHASVCHGQVLSVPEMTGHVCRDDPP